MIAFLSAYDENEKSGSKEKIGFLHINSKNEEDIKIEVSPFAASFARKFDLEKVYLFYGEKGKIVYDYSL